MTNYDELRQAHPKSTAGICTGCNLPWPCSTIALLDENEALRTGIHTLVDVIESAGLKITKSVHYAEAQNE